MKRSRWQCALTPHFCHINWMHGSCSAWLSWDNSDDTFKYVGTPATAKSMNAEFCVINQSIISSSRIKQVNHVNNEPE